METTASTLVPAELPVRFAARVIDAIVLSAVGTALGWPMGFGFDWLFVTALLVLAYFVLADALAGKTLGKAALGLRVTTMDGTNPSIKQALFREWFTLLGAIPFAGPFLAMGMWVWIAITIRSNELRRGVHDQWAGTRVVRR